MSRCAVVLQVLVTLLSLWYARADRTSCMGGDTLPPGEDCPTFDELRGKMIFKYRDAPLARQMPRISVEELELPENSHFRERRYDVMSILLSSLGHSLFSFSLGLFSIVVVFLSLIVWLTCASLAFGGCADVRLS